MPRVKIDYVVSFSNEDPENPASNLLSWDVSKKRWLCSKGEASCSVVLQLAKALKISSVQIGAHHAALVEVLVGRSETPSEPFQVLVPSSVFLTPKESRGDEGVDRVRSFEGLALAALAAAQRWDRLRVVCSQPYNKHCKYGISFIHIFEPDGTAVPPAPAPSPAVPLRMLSLDTFSSDEDEFRPGELFAKHRQSAASGDTGAQIRQATSQALKNNPDAATKLMKTPLSKHKPTSSTNRNHKEPRDTQRDTDNLLYTKDDDQPHAKIDHIVQRHKDEKSKDEAKTPKHKEKVDKTPKSKDEADTPKPKDNKNDKNSRSMRDEPSSSRSESKRDKDKTDSKKERDDRVRHADRNEASSSRKNDDSRKRAHSERNRADDASSSSLSRQSERQEKPLRGVVFVLSGYENPRRSRLRDLALSLGAACERDWGPRCTHLICAFSNTPKLKSVRSSPAGRRAGVARGEWIEECGRRGRLLPWQWFATEDRHRQTPPPSPPPPPPPAQSVDSECDTDDEIEKVLRQQKKARVSPSPSPRPAAPPAAPAEGRGDDSDSEVEFVKDERMQGNITVLESSSSGPDTEEEGQGEGVQGQEEQVSRAASLPAMFEGRSFVVEARSVRPLHAALLARYCTAYGGLVLTPDEVDEASDSHLVLCGEHPEDSHAGSGRRLRADWVWASHAARAALPLDTYLYS